MRFQDLYELREEIGKGAFSVVRRCTQKQTQKDYAAKIINTRRLSVRELQKLEREARICRKLNHSNIVRLHCSIPEEGFHYLIFDLVTGGELFDDIVAREYYSEHDASVCIQQILDSVNHCHINNIVHRDLKPENLLLENKSKGAAVKLADFGLAIEVDGDKQGKFGFAGTPGYLSPEVIKQDVYGKPADVWACGVILYILLVGYPPFYDEDQEKLYARIKLGHYDYPSPEWDTVTDEARHLIDSMLKVKPDERINASEALNHPWIKNKERVAAKFNRMDTLAGLRKLNARRKLKGAVLTAMIANKNFTGFRSQSSSGSSNKTPVPDISTEEMNVKIQEVEQPPTAVPNTVTRSAMNFFTQQFGNSQSKVVQISQPPIFEDVDESVVLAKKEVLSKVHSLLYYICVGDLDAYQEMVLPTMTCFEPETKGQLIEGTQFHQFMFESSKRDRPKVNCTMISPHVQLLGTDAAVVSYIRLVQCTNSANVTTTERWSETRVLHRVSDTWKLAHCHRSQ
ncbi:hypothetical protein ACHWQZ_G005323 [Mnemiopsis leidyi]